MVEEPTAKTDGRGRIIGSDGRPLRDRTSRTYGKQPFKGKSGKSHPRTAQLEARRKSYDEMKQVSGYHRPGSYKK